MWGRRVFEQDTDDSDVTFRDVITLALLGFVALVLCMLPHLNPVGSEAKEDAPPPGNVIVELRWPDELNTDVDLWVQAPGDRPVGYSNKGAAVFNLLRDDLGRPGDALDLNYENAYSRGVPAGEYTINVHLYRGQAPVEVKVQVSVRGGDSTRPLLTRRVTLAAEGEERTVVRFALDAQGNIRPGSVHGLFKPIRAAAR